MRNLVGIGHGQVLVVVARLSLKNILVELKAIQVGNYITAIAQDQLRYGRSYGRVA